MAQKLKSLISGIDEQIQNYCTNCFVPINDGSDNYIYTPPDTNDQFLMNLCIMRKKAINELRKLNGSPLETIVKNIEKIKNREENEIREKISYEIKNINNAPEYESIANAIKTNNYTKNCTIDKDAIAKIIEKMQMYKKNWVVKKVINELNRAMKN
jgi:hypothetical protein